MQLLHFPLLLLSSDMNIYSKEFIKHLRAPANFHLYYVCSVQGLEKHSISSNIFRDLFSHSV